MRHLDHAPPEKPIDQRNGRLHMARVTRAADIKAIREIDARWGDAASRHDVDAVVALYATDGTLVWPDAKKHMAPQRSSGPGRSSLPARLDWD